MKSLTIFVVFFFILIYLFRFVFAVSAAHFSESLTNNRFLANEEYLKMQPSRYQRPDVYIIVYNMYVFRMNLNWKEIEPTAMMVSVSGDTYFNWARK